MAVRAGRRQSAPGPPELFFVPHLKRSNQLLSSSRIRSHSFAISPRRRASFTINGVPTGIRGRSATPRGEQGMPGADAPAAARGVVGSTRVSHHGHTGLTRHSPRNGFNGFLRALPGDRAFLPPSPAKISFANLTPASGRQDHTSSPSASSAFVSGAIRVHRIPPCVRDVAQRPLSEAGPNRYIADLGSGSR
jgi:hypothetical protein